MATASPSAPPNAAVPHSASGPGASRAELLDRKRRQLADYLVAGDDLLTLLSAAAVPGADGDDLPAAEDLTPSLHRRDQALAAVARADRALAALAASRSAASLSDPAAEVVAEAALGRALHAAAAQDALLATALEAWQERLTAALADLSHRRRTLRGYASSAAAAHPDPRRPAVDEAA